MGDDHNFLSLFGHETKTQKLAPGDILFKSGEKADSLFIVKSGELQIFDGATVFETVGEGGILGEMAVVDQSPRSASVKAVTASEVIAVDQKRFLWMVAQTPFFAIRVMKVLTARLRKTDEMLKAKG
jgi:CRP/FNR family cyclic AMP-dependent transcriptional regulator